MKASMTDTQAQSLNLFYVEYVQDGSQHAPSTLTSHLRPRRHWVGYIPPVVLSAIIRITVATFWVGGDSSS